MGSGASKSAKVKDSFVSGTAVDTTPSTTTTIAVSAALQAFEWLNWTPASNTPCAQTLQRCFPGALPGQAVLKRTCATLKSKCGMTPENTIYGQSICPDEINNEKGDLADIMKEYWGEVFPMGGIGGAPFVGKTGFMAFSHHVPDDGHVLILFGPHIAVSKSGELGKYHRIGQAKESGSCGAVLAAYDQCCNPKDGVQMAFDMDDMQQSWLRQGICPRVGEAQAASDPLKVVTDIAYDVVRDKLLRIVNNNFGKGKLVLLGGIQINMPEPYDDHFQPKMFKVISKDGSEVDLLDSLNCSCDDMMKVVDCEPNSDVFTKVVN